jgi:hypothetical protein
VIFLVGEAVVAAARVEVRTGVEVELFVEDERALEFEAWATI